jgi:quinoprotein glucose dehydrogenase
MQDLTTLNRMRRMLRGLMAEAHDDFLPGTAYADWYDPERNLVFAPTGNTSPDFYGGLRDGLDAYSSAVVALDGSSGALRWYFQFVHHDVWDYDTPAQPLLVDLPVAGEVVPALVQVTKMGLTFALHRETGEPLYPVEERPAPGGAVAGDDLSPSQPVQPHFEPLLPAQIGPQDAWGFTPWDRGACRRRIAALRNEGLYTPPSLEGSIYYPGSAGGNNWGSPGYDPHTRRLVVVTNRYGASLTLKPRAECGDDVIMPQHGTPYCIVNEPLLSPLGVPCTAPPWSTLDAIDVDSGRVLWSVPLGTTRDMAPFPFWWIRGVPAVGGPLVTAGGVVFVGAAMDHRLRAFDIDSGELLWQARLPTAANAVPMSYQLDDGRQYIVVAVGGHWVGINPPGDYLMAFALPQASGAP